MSYIKFEELFQNLLQKLGLKSKIKNIDINKQKDFELLSRDDKLKIISPQLDIYVSAVSQKSEIFPIIATLAATLIVIATLNKELIPLSLLEIKIILSFFLILIPVTLHYYVKQKESTAENSLDIIRSYHSDDPFVSLEKVKFLQQLSSDFPIIIVYFFYGIIFFILFKIYL